TERTGRRRQERDSHQGRRREKRQQAKSPSRRKPALDHREQDASARDGSPEQGQRQRRERGPGTERVRKIEDGPVSIERLHHTVEKGEGGERAKTGARATALRGRGHCDVQWQTEADAEQYGREHADEKRH